MKRKTILTLFVALFALATQAQENTHNVVVQMADGTTITIGPNDLGSITFNNGEPVMVGALSLQEWIASLAKLQDVEQLRNELHAMIANEQNENYQFFVPLADYFDKSYWDRKEIGEALVALLEQIRSQAKNNQDGCMILEERHTIDVAEIRALLDDCSNRIEALEAAGVEDDPAVLAGLCPDSNHPHIIDLGAAGKWACCNVGATKPEEYGSYFAWGETEEKNDYDYTTYSLYYVIDDDADISGTAYDAAAANWGTPWIMPSFVQVMNLVRNCTEESVQVNGVNGIMLTGPNGNSIFLPAAGFRMEETLQEENEMGYYWSSTNHSFLPYGLEFDDERLVSFSPHLGAECGFPVRPMVFEPEVPIGEAIDLGLPSGTKWASCNVGASKPEEYGDYYAWGETKVKDYYDWSNYTLCDGSEGTCYDIGNEISGTLNDVAHVKWGGAWQMPTHSQCQELIDNCTVEWVEQDDGSYIIKYIGPNGNSILLPLAGYCSVGVYDVDGHDPYWDGGTWGEYWSGTLVTSDNNLAETLWAYDGMGNSSRCIGRTVRPVKK